jgi:acetyl-CoA carboxylase biotin carboxylase subunit
MHVRLADESVCIGPPPAAESYLNIPRIVAACEITGADAVHPGYGFLSENARFAEILEGHDITFIGPTSEHIRIMGDKIEAKATAKRLGIPTVPGSQGAITNETDALKIARDMGYPVLVKAAAGGGGRGMKVARTPDELDTAIKTARAEAKAAFGDDSVYLEKYLAKPRHIEIQVFGDGKGNAIHLGERDCSLQRRHQKILEEAPSPALNAEERKEIGATVAAAMRKLQYRGAGTVEFLYEDGKFFFIEMNTRLQVEHPVTEMITGLDLVIEQIRVAAGNALTLQQRDVIFSGHAIECRINAENPETFMPSPGVITYWHPPGGLGVRVDSGVYQGYRIPPYYDSLIGKLIVHGKNRNEALMRLKRCLSEFVIDGIDTTIPLFARLTKEPDIANGLYNIHWLESFLQKPAQSHSSAS